MIITLVGENKIHSIRLPKKVAGQFWITDEDNNFLDNRLIGIDSDTESQTWKITSNRKLQIFDISTMEKIKVARIRSNEMYYLNMGNGLSQRAFLFAEPYTEDRCRFVKYRVKTEGECKIGSDEENGIVINNPFVSAEHAQISFRNGKWLIRDRESANGVYINRRRLYSEKTLVPGDIVYIMGCKIVIGDCYIAINNPDHQLQIKSEMFEEYPIQQLMHYEEPELEDVNYYYRSPNFKRNIKCLELKIDAPTQKQAEDDTPIILTIAPTLMMGVASLASGIVTTINALNRGGSIMSSVPTLVMSVSMLCGMVIFPFFMKSRDKKTKRRREKERITKYLKYLENIRHEIRKAEGVQSEILRENNPEIMKRIQETDFFTRKLWNMKMTDADFLTFRFGIGNVPLNADISFPEERFSVEEDELREELIRFSEEKQIITDVPLVVSLMTSRIIGIYGEQQERNNLLHNIILQLDALYSYDEVKLIFIGNKKEERTFSYVKWMQHIWDDEKRFRYYAINVDDVKAIGAQVGKIIQQSDEESDIRQHYVVISTSKDLADKCSFISDILAKTNLEMFHLICAYEQLSQLPKECDVLVKLSNGKGLIDFITSQDSGRTNFTQDVLSGENVAEVVRKIADISLDLQKGKYALPGMLTFMDMFRVGKISHLNIRQRWKENNPVLSLQTPIGVDVNGNVFYLDLHEKYHGPHGLVAGMTGSGKSEFIITYILSLAVNYHPDEVAFVLIDYKGGGLTGAFENDKYRLPHLAGTITNLDGAAITRSILSIKSELRKRQAIFNQARRIANEGTMDIYKYQKMYRSGMVSEPVPHLFIISDEFAELKSQQPEFMEQLISTARIGRSLGVHLILATQKPSGVVNEQIWANSRFKVCLKVQDKADSMDMLKRADAAEIAETGRFYLQVGYNEIFEKGQSAWCGAPYYERDFVENELDGGIEIIDNVGNVIEDIKVRKEGEQKANGKQIVRIMEYLSELAKEENINERQLWLPEIPAVILWDALREKYEYKKGKELVAAVGELDDPYRQTQELLTVDFSQNGNVLIYGTAGSGKELFLTTMLYSLFSDYSAEKINTYVLDFGAETLKAFAKAPQMGEVIIDGEEDKVENFIGMLHKEIETRKKLFSDYGGDYASYSQSGEQNIPYFLVMINNYSRFMESYEKYETTLISLTRECTKYGIYFVITEATINGIRHRMAQNFNQIYVMQLNDKSEYIGILGSTGGVYPPKVEGRGILKKDETYVFQIAHVVSENEGTGRFIREKCKELERNATIHAKGVPVIPETLCGNDLIGDAVSFNRVPIGMACESFRIMEQDFETKCVKQILLQNLNDAIPFLNEYLKTISRIPQVEIRVFADKNAGIRNDLNGIKLITENYEEDVREIFATAVERNNNYKSTNGNPTVDMHPVINVIHSLDFLKKQITEDGWSKLFNSLDKTVGKYNIGYVILEDIQSVNRYCSDAWYIHQCNGEGLWIGEGFTEQFRLPAMGNRAIYKKKIDNTFGYLVEGGKPQLLKLATQKEDSDNE